jgi:hypothetical protein
VFGKIVRIIKDYTYDKTRQPWGHVTCYHVFFCKEGETFSGWIGGERYTFDKYFRKRVDMKRFLMQNGYTKQDMEVFQC